MLITDSAIFSTVFGSSAVRSADLSNLVKSSQQSLVPSSISNELTASLRLSTSYNLLAAVAGFENYAQLNDILATAYPDNTSKVDKYI